ncbi:MAG: T9SS type A sorting domain-containing protein, partial [Lentimicrobium sp.]|uniref:T9SS type A sorting domain-containing protein n=1 Tax=Lentimicrobium sp. TaxID=2034841 RepID=UPI0025E3E1A1
LLWNKFMANPEIAPMLEAIGFVPDPFGSQEIDPHPDQIRISPNPLNQDYFSIRIKLALPDLLTISIHDISGKEAASPYTLTYLDNGEVSCNIGTGSMKKGIYFLTIIGTHHKSTHKLIIQ